MEAPKTTCFQCLLMKPGLFEPDASNQSGPVWLTDMYPVSQWVSHLIAPYGFIWGFDFEKHSSFPAFNLFSTPKSGPVSTTIVYKRSTSSHNISFAIKKQSVYHYSSYQERALTWLDSWLTESVCEKKSEQRVFFSFLPASFRPSLTTVVQVANWLK